MQKTAVCLALLLAACAAPLPNVPPSGMSAEVSAPTARAGEAWDYVAHDGYTGLPTGSFDYRVTGVDKSSVTVAAQHGNQSWTERYTHDWNWLDHPMTNLYAIFRFNPPYPALPFPLAAGKSWHTYVEAADPSTGRVNRVRVDGQVLGWQRVSVPAGQFETLKIERHVYAGNAHDFIGEEQIVERDWYAPQIGLIVRSEAKSQHIDTSKSCRFANCMWIQGDYTVKELASYKKAP